MVLNESCQVNFFLRGWAAIFINLSLFLYYFPILQKTKVLLRDMKFSVKNWKGLKFDPTCKLTN